MKIEIDCDRLSRELEGLAAISSEPAPAVTRVVFTDADLRARVFVKHLCRDAGLAVREDAAGNTFARWTGEQPDLPPVATGSHIDAIPNAGRYDGTVGALGGLEAIRALLRAGFRPGHSIELIVFTSEEPTRFGIGCLGSRLMAGVLDESAGRRLVDRDGISLDSARAGAGFTGRLSAVRLPSGAYSAFIELHIEQGPLLEERQIDLGVVTAIAAPATLRVWVEGQGGHAGAVLMPDRRDAFLAAAEIALAVEAAARSTGALDTVATTGVCDLFPGAVNSIPSSVRLEVDVHDVNLARRDAVLQKISEAAQAVATRRRVTVRSETLNADAPAQCATDVIAALVQACETHGFSSDLMISRAYHDCLFMSRIAPAAMLFIPCRGASAIAPMNTRHPKRLPEAPWCSRKLSSVSRNRVDLKPRDT